MAKFETQLARMESLMNYKPSLNENKNTSPIEYKTLGADGKVYGIIREGSKYYIKTSTPGKENIVESYSYINGFNYRNENGFNSYNEATKQLEMKLINLNEAKGIHKDVSTVDFSKNTKVFKDLTLEARKEINRVNQIIENSGKIGMNNTGDPESNGSSTGENTKKNNEPFELPATASLDKDLTAKATDPKSQGYDSVRVDADRKLQGADKMERGNRGDEGYETVNCQGSVACQKPSGAKAVKMNEEFDDIESLLDDFDNEDANIEIDIPNVEIEIDGIEPEENDNTEFIITDDEDSVCEDDSCCTTDCEFLNSYNRKGTLPAQSWDKMNEGRINRIAKRVMNELLNESTTTLDAWGKHPKYRKQPMTVPANKEKFVGTGDRDWNDESAKGEEPYGKRIGSSAPFTNMANLIATEITKALKESSLKKK